jgi:hypothetical protein
MLYMGDEYGEFGGRDPDNRHMWRPETKLSQREKGLLGEVRKLGIARQAHPALRRGGYKSLGATETMLPFVRFGPGLKTALVVIHSGAASASFTLPASAPYFADGSHADLLGFGGQLKVAQGEATVTVGARSCAVFVDSP